MRRDSKGPCMLLSLLQIATPVGTTRDVRIRKKSRTILIVSRKYLDTAAFCSSGRCRKSCGKRILCLVRPQPTWNIGVPVDRQIRVLLTYWLLLAIAASQSSGNIYWQ